MHSICVCCWFRLLSLMQVLEFLIIPLPFISSQKCFRTPSHCTEWPRKNFSVCHATRDIFSFCKKVIVFANSRSIVLYISLKCHSIMQFSLKISNLVIKLFCTFLNLFSMFNRVALYQKHHVQTVKFFLRHSVLSTWEGQILRWAKCTLGISSFPKYKNQVKTGL